MREPIKQNASGLYTDIQKIGCFFRSACCMAEFEAEKQGKRKCRLTVAQLNALWDAANTLHYIENRMTKNSAGIANLALNVLKVKGKFVEVATFQSGRMNWYGAVKTRRADYFIQKIKTEYTEGTHFRNVDKYGVLTFDPYKPAIEPKGIFYSICYRFDEGE